MHLGKFVVDLFAETISFKSPGRLSAIYPLPIKRRLSSQEQNAGRTSAANREELTSDEEDCQSVAQDMIAKREEQQLRRRSSEGPGSSKVRISFWMTIASSRFDSDKLQFK